MGIKSKDGCITVYSRADDVIIILKKVKFLFWIIFEKKLKVINVAGHRLSSAAIEEVSNNTINNYIPIKY